MSTNLSLFSWIQVKREWVRYYSQDGRPVVYASRVLRDTETKYAQIETEMLAVVWRLERFHQYTFVKHIVVQSDLKPLESLMCKPLSKAPRILQGIMHLMKYDT